MMTTQFEGEGLSGRTTSEGFFLRLPLFKFGVGALTAISLCCLTQVKTYFLW